MPSASENIRPLMLRAWARSGAAQVQRPRKSQPSARVGSGEAAGAIRAPQKTPRGKVSAHQRMMFSRMGRADRHRRARRASMQTRSHPSAVRRGRGIVSGGVLATGADGTRVGDSPDPSGQRVASRSGLAQALACGPARGSAFRSGPQIARQRLAPLGLGFAKVRSLRTCGRKFWGH